MSFTARSNYTEQSLYSFSNLFLFSTVLFNSLFNLSTFPYAISTSFYFTANLALSPSTVCCASAIAIFLGLTFLLTK